MKTLQTTILSLFAVCTVFCATIANAGPAAPLITQKIQQNLTPDQVLQRLKMGNERFLAQKPLAIDFLKKAKITAKGQYPGAIILSCIDSRVPPEIIFDQAVGNIFVSRVAANVLNSDALGGMEFATKVAGAKLIVVMGHDACGAVRGACQNVKLGHLTKLLAKVKPAITQAKQQMGKIDCNSEKFIDTAAADNVRNMVRAIPTESPIIRQLVKAGKVKIVGAMYHLDSGKVTFLN